MRDPARIGIPEAHQQLRRRGLAGTRRTDQGHRLRRPGWSKPAPCSAGRALARIVEGHLLEGQRHAAPVRCGDARAVGRPAPAR